MFWGIIIIIITPSGSGTIAPDPGVLTLLPQVVVAQILVTWYCYPNAQCPIHITSDPSILKL